MRHRRRRRRRRRRRKSCRMFGSTRLETCGRVSPGGTQAALSDTFAFTSGVHAGGLGPLSEHGGGINSSKPSPRTYRYRGDEIRCSGRKETPWVDTRRQVRGVVRKHDVLRLGEGLLPAAAVRENGMIASRASTEGPRNQYSGEAVGGMQACGMEGAAGVSGRCCCSRRSAHHTTPGAGCTPHRTTPHLSK